MTRILLVSTTAIGDTIMATPFIRAVRLSNPDAKISFLVHFKRRELLEQNPHLNELISYRGKGKGVLPLMWKLKRGAFDRVIVLHANDPDIVPLVRWTGAPERVGWGESKWAGLFTHTILRTHPPEHFMLHKKRLLESVGIPVSDLHTEIFLTPEDLRAHETVIMPWLQSVRAERFVAMHAFGSHSQKWWSLDRFFGVADFIYQTSGHPTVFLGDPESSALVRNHPRFHAGRHLAPGLFSLRQSVAVLSKAWRMLTTDSGPMHMAFAVKCSTLCLFGPTHPELHGPCFDRDLHRVLQRNPLLNLTEEEVCETWREWVVSTSPSLRGSGA